MNLEKYVCEIVPVYRRKSKLKQIQIINSEDAVQYIRGFFPKNKINIQEYFGLVFLNNNLIAVGYNLTHQGGIAECNVCTKTIIRNTLICNASAVVIFHNHPSGNTKASKSDVEVTNKIKKALEVCDIKLLDSLIITEKNYSSII